MDENIELLEFIYETSEMGASSLTDLLKSLSTKENKIKKVCEDILKEYEKFVKESGKYLEKSDTTPRTKGGMAKMMSKMGIKKEVMMDNSDASITHMLVQGLTMGIVDMQSKIDNYKDTALKKYLKLGKDFLEFQENSVEKLKPYL